MDDYLQLISHLPLPTVEQTQAFGERVAREHSWYKHLPVAPPGDVFLFFLDPQAGRLVQEGYWSVAAGNDQGPERRVFRRCTTVEDVERSGYSSTKSTRDYLERFGHWRYCHGSYEAFLNAKLNVWAVESVDFGPDSSLKAFDASLPVNLSEKVRQQCFCQLTAFISGFVKHRCTLADLPCVLRSLQSYLETKPDAAPARSVQKLRWDLEEAGVYGWVQDTVCDLEIAPRNSSLSLSENPKSIQFRSARNLRLQFDLGSFPADEQSTQHAALSLGLQRSRALFARVCRPAKS
jgi:hypothetical protein